jgi:DNA-binding transcriptional regulator/RsmH inhibitor MraZ
MGTLGKQLNADSRTTHCMAEAESRLPMFTDELERQLDSGLRVMLPKDWRSLNITDFVLISDSSSSFIKVFPQSEYDKFVAKIESDPMLDEQTRNEHLEEIGSTCKKVELDNAGRLALPANMCAEIGIGEKNPTVILKGAVRTFNVWNPARLKKKQEAKQKLADTGRTPLSAKKFLGV